MCKIESGIAGGRLLAVLVVPLAGERGGGLRKSPSSSGPLTDCCRLRTPRPLPALAPHAGAIDRLHAVGAVRTLPRVVDADCALLLEVRDDSAGRSL
jgi:hypothetical protein